MALSTGYWASQTLLTANRLKLFDVLADGGKTAEEVASELELNARATTLLLNACVALGLCECDDGNYANSIASATFLQSSSPASLANAISYSDDLYDTWGDLEQAVRTGIPPKRAETYLGENEDQTRHFVYGMHDRAMAIGRALTGMVDLTGRKRMLDVGGGPGTYSALLTDRYTGLVADVLELQGVASIADEILKESGADKRVTMMPGDYHVSEFGGGYDVVLMSGMFHRETEANCRVLIQKARDCLEHHRHTFISPGFLENFVSDRCDALQFQNIRDETRVTVRQESRIGTGTTAYIQHTLAPGQIYHTGQCTTDRHRTIVHAVNEMTSLIFVLTEVSLRPLWRNSRSYSLLEIAPGIVQIIAIADCICQ